MSMEIEDAIERLNKVGLEAQYIGAKYPNDYTDRIMMLFGGSKSSATMWVRGFTQMQNRLHLIFGLKQNSGLHALKIWTLPAILEFIVIPQRLGTVLGLFANCSAVGIHKG